MNYELWEATDDDLISTFIDPKTTKNLNPDGIVDEHLNVSPGLDYLLHCKCLYLTGERKD